MTSLRFARHLLLTLAAFSAMLLGACHDDGLITPPDSDNDSCCAVINVTVNRSGSDAPLAGVAVALRKGMDVVATKETNAQGIATFQNVCNAEYNLRLTKDGYSVAEKGDIFVERCDTTRVAIAMRTTTTTEPPDSCCNSTLRIIPTNESGAPVSGAQVKITGANGVVRVAESTLDGAFFRELCRGAYSIRIAREGFRVHESRIEIGCGENLVERRGLLKGDEPVDSCCKARLVIGARDAATGALLSGAIVKLWRGGQLFRTVAIQDRAAIFEELCEGGYGYSIHREGYRAVEGDVRVDCNGIAEVWRTLERMEKDSCCNNIATVRILDGNTRRPVANAYVFIFKGRMAIDTTRSNADGYARFDGLCEGEYSVLVEREGYRPTDPRINVICRVGAEITVILMPNAPPPPPDTCCNASIRLRVLDGTYDREMPLMGAHVVVKYGGAVIANGTTNQEGIYSRGELCGRRVYVVVLEKEGFNRLALEIPIEECRLIERTVRMIPL